MAKRTLSEKQVLKKLGIKDFRHMTKDKVVKFATMLPYMDPEVAKAALEQFPTFKELATDLVAQYKEILEKAFDKNEESQKAFYDACNEVIHSLQKELEDTDITPEERDRIEDKMIHVAVMIGEKDSENKKFLLKILSYLGIGILFIFGIGASLLGSNTKLSTSGDDDDDDDDTDYTQYVS